MFYFASFPVFVLESNDNQINAKLGVKDYYSTGITCSYFYYKSYTKIKYIADLFVISCGYYSFQNYQVIDVKDKYKTYTFKNADGSGDIPHSIKLYLKTNSGLHIKRKHYQAQCNCAYTKRIKKI